MHQEYFLVEKLICKNEYITVDQAKEDYGVLVDPETFKVLGLTEERQKAENNLTIIKSEMSTDTNAVNLYIFKTMISEKVAFFNCILL